MGRISEKGNEKRCGVKRTGWKGKIKKKGKEVKERKKGKREMEKRGRKEKEVKKRSSVGVSLFSSYLMVEN